VVPGELWRKITTQNADAMLHLTATPIHLDSEDLFSLLNILYDEEFPNLYTVDNLFRNNEPIIRAQVCLGHLPPNIIDAIQFFEEISGFTRSMNGIVLTNIVKYI